MDPYSKNKSLLNAPSFSSAPNIDSSIPVPSFSSAPDLSLADNEKEEERKSRRDRSLTYRLSRERSRSPKRSKRRRDDRSRSPQSARRRHRSQSPRSRRRSRSSSSDRHRRKRSPSSRRERSSRHERSSRSKRSPSPVTQTGTLNTGLTFVMDKTGDANNLKYGGNHSYSVPEYKRSGGGRVLGLSPNTRIDISVIKSGTITITDKSSKKQSRYTDSDYTWKELDRNMKRIHITQKKENKSTDPFASNIEVIKLDDNAIKSHTNENELYASSGVDYRSLEGNKVKRYPSEDEEEGEEEGESFNDQTRQRTIDFNRRLDQEPENVQLWLDFIKFQDDAAAGLDPNALKGVNKGSLNEVKLSIFEKALDHNPTNEDLIHAYLACGAETWETLKLLREWDTMLKQHPDSIKLWSDYINLRQTNFASFSFTQCVQVFEDALATLNRHARRKINGYEDREDIESLMVYILLRACLFMKQAGYQEKAFAVIQAAVEFNLFQPQLFNMASSPNEDKINAFVDFWDSEAIRFGEDGALGWHEYYRATDSGEEISEPVFEQVKVDADNDEDEVLTLRDWFNLEKASEDKDRLPLRMSQAEDDTMDEDPYRITLSDDIKSFLFNITTENARHSLIYSIFVFIGLPYTPPEVGTNTHFCTDTFTHNDLALQYFWPPKENATKHLVWYVDGVPMNPEETVEIKTPFYIPNSYPVGLNELFAKSESWFKAAGKEFVPNTVDERFTRNVFQQLLSVEKSEHLTICCLAFESSCGNKLGRKLAKSLLEKHHTSLTLWNAYAQMEKSHGRLDQARKVYLTALSMYHTFPKSDQIMLPLLYYMFAKLELEDGEPNEALKILASISDDKPYDKNTPAPTSIIVLKTREYFSQKLAQTSILSESSQERQVAFNVIRCSGLFEYLSSGLESAVSTYQHALEYIMGYKAERGYESELIWMELTSMMYYHSTKGIGGYKPSLFRQKLEQALQLFPNNTIFISFYVWNESKTKIYNRVNDWFNTSFKKESNVILWLSAIYSELHKNKPYHINSIRDLFERSISDKRTRSSIILWKNYIQFELNLDNTERAKNLFYRSLRECPWSKELYLIGFRSFEKTMDEKEVNELVSLMMEKEIRLRNPIDEDLLT